MASGVKAHVPQRVKQPLVPVAMAMLLGIISARQLDIALPTLLRLFAGCVVLYLVCALRTGVARMTVYLAIASLSGAWYLEWVTKDGPPGIASYATQEFRLCRLRGIVHDQPLVVLREVRAGIPVEEWTRFSLDVKAVWSDAKWIPANGRLDVHVKGVLPALGTGDEISLLGWLSEPARPQSPGQFDYADFLIGRGIHAILRSEDARSVVITRKNLGQFLVAKRDAIREWGKSIYQRVLSPKAADLAATMILGYRTALADEELEPYQATGTLHLLVVSGTHLVIASWILWPIAALVAANLRLRVLLILGFTLAYAFLTGGDPPVVRAAVVIGFWLGGFLLSRHPQPINSLAAAAIALLILNPTTLFRIGTQLSFLAVITIVLFVPVIGPALEHPYEERWTRRVIQQGRDFLVNGFVVSLVVGLVLSPLMVSYFHLVTPIGILLSTVLLPLVTLGLLFGIALLLFAPLGTATLSIVAAPTDGLFRLIQWLVTFSDQLSFGHSYVLAYPDWWMLGFYVLLFCPLMLSRTARISVGYLRANLMWMGIGGALLLWPSRPQGLEYHQLAVGHGNCGVLRFSNNQTILYDCGSLTTPDIVERVVAPWLWSNGVGTIDAVVLSHADLDHFNGLVDLCERFPIRKLLLSPQTAHSPQPDLAAALHELIRDGVGVQLIWEGDQIIVGDAAIRVMQPRPTEIFSSDNESSLVIECRWRRHRLVLTGDLSHRGMDKLLSRAAETVDVMIAPHHGSRLSNPPELAAWARAPLVLSTQGRVRGGIDGLGHYRELGSVVLRTDQEGTISCRWLQGSLEVSTFGSGKRWRLPLAEIGTVAE